ncbi:MAG: hypothetical protein MMC23_000115 [Stictis urceolatum]|nr:hypothetical protein [Stictis urceolata]
MDKEQYLPAIWYPMDTSVDIFYYKRMWSWIISGAQKLQLDEVSSLQLKDCIQRSPVCQEIGPYESYGLHHYNLNILNPSYRQYLYRLPRIPEQPLRREDLRVIDDVGDSKAPSVLALFPVDPFLQLPYQRSGEDTSLETGIQAPYARSASLSTDSDIADYGIDFYRVPPTQDPQHGYFNDRQLFVAYDNKLDLYLEDSRAGISWKKDKVQKSYKANLEIQQKRDYFGRALLPGRRWSRENLIEWNCDFGCYVWPDLHMSDEYLIDKKREEAMRTLAGRQRFSSSFRAIAMSWIQNPYQSQEEDMVPPPVRHCDEDSDDEGYDDDVEAAENEW